MSTLAELPNTGPVDVTVVANWRVLGNVWAAPSGRRLPWVNIAGTWIRAAVDLRGADFAPDLCAAGAPSTPIERRLSLTVDRPKYIGSVLALVTTYRFAVESCAINRRLSGSHLVLAARCHPVSVSTADGWQVNDPRLPQFRAGAHRR